MKKIMFSKLLICVFAISGIGSLGEPLALSDPYEMQESHGYVLPEGDEEKLKTAEAAPSRYRNAP